MAVKPETVKRFSIEAKAKQTEKAKDDHIARLESSINKLKFRMEQLSRMVDALCEHRSHKVNPKDTSLDAVIDYVAITMRVERDQILSRTRDHGDVDRARSLGMWLAKRLGNYTLGQIAKAFNRTNHATVSHAIKTVEKSDRALAKRMADDFIERNHHAEAETTTGRGGTTSEGEGMAGTDERPIPGTDGERKTGTASSVHGEPKTGEDL